MDTLARPADLTFFEGKRTLIRSAICGLLVLGMGIFAFAKPNNYAYLPHVLCAAGAFMLVIAFAHRSVGSTPYMVFKDDGIWFHNADGPVPYETIHALLEIGGFNTFFLQNIQADLVPGSGDQLPTFKHSRLDLLLMMGHARSGRSFRKDILVFSFSGLRCNGKTAYGDDVMEEIANRIEYALKVQGIGQPLGSASHIGMRDHA